MSVKSNIWKIYAIQALRWFMVAMPIMALFFLENGLSLTEILILQAVFSITIVAIEIPSGYWSDLFGRKNAIVLGCILGFLGYLIYSLSFGFWGFLFAEVLLGLGSGLVSGADSALLYDSLQQEKEQKNYKKFEGRKNFFESGSEGLASVLGGFLALTSLRLPFYIETITLFLSIPIALSLVEPARQKLNNLEGNFRTLLRIVKFSLVEQKAIKWVIIYSAVVSASGLAVVWFIQPYLFDRGLPLVMFGIIWAVFQFVTAAFSFYAHAIEDFFGKKNLFISLIFLILAGYLTIGLFLSLWAAAGFLIFYFVRGVAGPMTRYYVNELTGSDIRATVLSVKNLVARLIFSIVGPILGYAADVFSVETALLLSGAIFFTTGVIVLTFLHKHKVI